MKGTERARRAKSQDLVVKVRRSNTYWRKALHDIGKVMDLIVRSILEGMNYLLYVFKELENPLVSQNNICSSPLCYQLFFLSVTFCLWLVSSLPMKIKI